MFGTARIHNNVIRLWWFQQRTARAVGCSALMQEWPR